MTGFFIYLYTTKTYYQMENLNVKMLVGYPVAGIYTRDVQLLRSNAITEEIATRKLPQNPYTWIANVISCFAGQIGSANVAESVRKQYLDTGTVVIPQVVKDMPLADANSLLLDIHRLCWKNLLSNQKIICKTCTRSLIVDVDLNNIKPDEKGLKFLSETPEVSHLFVDLKDPISFAELVKKIEAVNAGNVDAEVKDASLATYNRLVFRVPKLSDAIKNEDHVSRNIDFWRRMALDTLTAVQNVRIDDKGTATVMDEFPIHLVNGLGLKLFFYFSGEDLRLIRNTLIEELPTMPFAYEDTCPCDRQSKIPYIMEATDFFSE